MNFALTPRWAVRLCTAAFLSVCMILPVGAAEAATTGTVVAWGCGPGGVEGDGADTGQCSVPENLSGVVAISAGAFHSLAVRADGHVVAWGCRGRDGGQCGVPADLSGVTAVAAGTFHSLALRRDGTVVAWGCGSFDGGECSVPSGLSDVTAVAAGEFQSLALKRDGTVVAWGCGSFDVGQCTVPSGLSGVTAIAAGYAHSLALLADGSVVAWGCAALNRGQCSVPGDLLPATAIAAGQVHSLALQTDGTVAGWSCGFLADYGQCTPSGALSAVTAIAAGSFHSLALKADGTVTAWGCGSGTDAGQCTVPAALSSVAAVAAGYNHSLALVRGPNAAPDCLGVTAVPGSLWPKSPGLMARVRLVGATDPDGDALAYRIDGVTQDEAVSGAGDGTFPDAALTPAGVSSSEVLVRAEANPHRDGRVYRIAFTVSDGNGGTCSGTAGPSGSTTAKVSVPRKKDAFAVDDGDSTSWDAFTGAAVP